MKKQSLSAFAETNVTWDGSDLEAEVEVGPFRIRLGLTERSASYGVHVGGYFLGSGSGGGLPSPDAFERALMKLGFTEGVPAKPGHRVAARQLGTRRLQSGERLPVPRRTSK